MSVEILGRAGASMRDRFEREDVDDVQEAEFYLAVADWLDDAAVWAEETGNTDRHALTVARAHLGESRERGTP